MREHRQLDIDDDTRALMAETYQKAPERARRGMYEMEYYNLYGTLPEDAWVIERVEWVGDSPIIVHYEWVTVKH